MHNIIYLIYRKDKKKSDYTLEQNESHMAFHIPLNVNQEVEDKRGWFIIIIDLLREAIPINTCFLIEIANHNHDSGMTDNNFFLADLNI